MPSQARVVWDTAFTRYDFGPTHPMAPIRLDLTARLCDALGVTAPAPDDLIGSLASVPLPAGRPGSPAATLDFERLALWTRERGVESWFFPWDGGMLVRASAQVYNHESQYVRLAELLREALDG